MAILDTVPAMLALTFFGILHVPINVPALGVSTGQDNVDTNRELVAHGWSNLLSGGVGTVQSKCVYLNEKWSRAIQTGSLRSFSLSSYYIR